MKGFKILAVLLALLTALSCFAACGDSGKNTETTTPDKDTSLPEQKLDEWGREYIDDNVPKNLTFAGEENNTLTFFTRSNDSYWAIEMDVDQTINDTVNDAIFYRNDTVEHRLGVTITQISQPFDFGGQWNQTLRNSVLTKSGDYQAAAIYASQSCGLATEGMYLDVNTLNYLDLDKPWWNQRSREELELFNTLYFLTGDIAISQLLNAGMITYNKKLLEIYYNDLDIYKLVDDYKWTIDKLYELSSSVHEDLNSSGMIDDGDVAGLVHWQYDSKDGGFVDLWVGALGISLTTKDESGIPQITVYNEHSIQAFEKLKKLCVENPGCLDQSKLSITKFGDSKALFSTNILKMCEGFRHMTDSYGALPLPMFDEEQGYYGTYSQNGCSLIVVCSALPEEQRDMVGATLELMAAESYRQVTPAYMEVCLRSKYSDSPDDARMYDLIVDGISMDFGYIYSSKNIGYMISLFRDLTSDFAKDYESNKILYETSLETLIDKLDEVSFVQ